MNESNKAVFLSYASEDAEAAQRIANGLRAAGIEVWFDKSELRGGDTWDQSIRKQIKNCALFLPIISHTTHDRREGYFRLEWKLAIDRSHLMDANLAFLLPIVIDDTRDDDERVPERFRDVQWTRLPGGECTSSFVERIRGLLAPVPTRPTLTPGASPSPNANVAIRTGGLRARRRWQVTLALSIVIAATAYLVANKTWWSKRSAGQPVQRLPTTESQAAPATDKSVAVLPLKNESDDPKQDYFSDGLSEDLITALSHVSELKVIGRTSSFHFKNSQEDSASIGRQLGVAHLIEGSVRRDAQTIRVSAELIHAADGRTLWSERYDRPYKNLFVLQDELTLALTQALKARLLPIAQNRRETDRPTSGNLDAYNAYLRGQFFGNRLTEPGMRQAVSHFIQATRLDPNYVQAWSELSIAWRYIGGNWLEGQAMKEAYAKARAAAETARALAPDAVATHLAWGNLLRFANFDQRGAEMEFRRAFELAPDNSEVKSALAAQLAAIGQLEPAVALVREALALDPLQATAYDALGRYFLGLNRLDEAEDAVRRAIALQPDAPAYYQSLATIQIQRGDAKAALESAQQSPPGVFADTDLALARAISSDQVAADAALKTLIDRWAGVSAYQIAQIYALRHDPERMFQWLDRAWAQRDAGITFLLYDPFVLRFKDDPRLAAFCRKVGLPTPAEVAARGKSKGP